MATGAVVPTLMLVLRLVRRLSFAAVMIHATLVLTSVARPDACADVWSWHAERHDCCAMSNQTRWSPAGGDCCDYGVLEDRDAVGFPTALSVAPAGVAMLPAPSAEVPPAEARYLRADRAVPERPPDRALRTTILLI